MSGDPLPDLSVPPVPLTQLAALIGAQSATSVPVTGVTQASGEVRPGDLFAALPGARTHGAAFAAAAAAAGAVAILTDPVGQPAAAATGLPVLVADDPRARLGALAAAVYRTHDGPQVLGVTGTNGKTTVVHLLAAGLTGAGVSAGTLGTLGASIGERHWPAVRTTPESPEVHAWLARMRQAGVTVAAMEVSSHALALHRVDGVRFAVAGFTNLARDHLDFHRDMTDYLNAKARLFAAERTDRAVVCVDSEAADDLLAQVQVPTITVATTARQADVTVTVTKADGSGSQAQLLFPDGRRVALQVRLPGRFNVANAAVALVMLQAAGVDPEEAAAGIAELAAVPGRMEPVDAGQPFAVVVDYAHTPDALTRVLQDVRSAGGRLSVVFGCGGDRDAGKRPLMGSVAARLADLMVITDDNPRSEDPGQIRAAILAGATAVPVDDRAEVRVIGDRAEAIAAAFAAAGPGDVVVIAGKGAEQGQEVDGVVTAFDDRAVARALLTGASPR